MALSWPLAIAALELKPADFVPNPAMPAEARTRQAFQNFRFTLVAKGPGELLLPGGLRVPLPAESKEFSIVADGREVRINGSKPLKRTLESSPLGYTPAASVQLSNINMTPLPPGPAIGDSVKGAIPNFEKLTGPKGLFVLFVRSADW